MTGERYKLPKGWVRTTVKEIAEIITGNTPSKSDKSNYGNFLPWVKPPQLDSDGPIINTAEKLSEKGAKLGRVLPKDSVLVSCIGLLGKVGLAGCELATNQQINSLTFHEGFFPKYGYFYCKSKYFKDWLQSAASATTVPIVNKGRFSETPILIAPLNEQKRIVKKIESLLAHLNKTKQELTKIPPLIKKLRQSVLAKAFTGELTKEWRDQQENLEPASALLARIRKERKKKLSKKYREPEPIDTSNPPELPEGWEPSSIEELSELVTKGSTPTSYGYEYQATGIAFVKVENISDGYIAYKTIKQFINRETHNFLKRSQLKENDILFSIAGTIGRACIIRSGDLPANTNQALAIIRVPSPFIDKHFLLKYLTSHSAQLVARSGVRGVGMSNIGLRNVRNLIVPIPPYLEQLEIMKEIERLSTRVDLVEKAVQIAQAHCQKLAQSILAKAFRGELVEQDPGDEPASILLEKIKSEKGRMSIQNRVGSDA